MRIFSETILSHMHKQGSFCGYGPFNITKKMDFQVIKRVLKA